MWYKTFLPKLHAIVKPRTYVEIGIRHGYSLSISPTAQKIAIDPNFGATEMQFDTPHTKFFRMTSDDFFAQHDLDTLLPQGFDLAYIDGLHLFEFALRDFINLEYKSRDDSVIIVDDVIPRNPTEGARTATGGQWAGDVWKMIYCFRDYRPDLFESMILTRSEPTGCLIVRNPRRDDDRLRRHYGEIVARYTTADHPDMPDDLFVQKGRTAQQALDTLAAHPVPR